MRALNKRAAQSKALAQLAGMKTYAGWLASATEEQLRAADAVAGGRQRVYDNALASLILLAGLNAEDAAAARASAYQK